MTNFKKSLIARWWNVNGRWNMIHRNFRDDVDILFLIETHCNCSTMPVLKGYKKIGGPKLPLTASQGGLVVYVKNKLYEHNQMIRYARCSISFRISFIPNVVFTSAYMYPYDSLNFLNSDFWQLYHAKSSSG